MIYEQATATSTKSDEGQNVEQKKKDSYKKESESEKLARFMSARGAPRGANIIMIRASARPLPQQLQSEYYDGYLFEGILESSNTSEMTLEMWKEKITFSLVSKGRESTQVIQTKRNGSILKFYRVEELSNLVSKQWVQVIAAKNSRRAYKISFY